MTADGSPARTLSTCPGASTAKFWAAFVGIVVALGVAFTTFETQLGSLKSRLNTGVFAAGHWPPATTSNWNDASMSDGDPTTWRYKP